MKSWYTSKTIQGVLIMALTYLYGKFGIDPTVGVEATVQTLLTLAETIGAVWTAVGVRNALADGSVPVGK